MCVACGASVPDAQAAAQQRWIALNKALTSKKKIPLKLFKRTEINDSVRLWRFTLPSDDMVLGLPCGKHFLVYALVTELSHNANDDAAVTSTPKKSLCMRAYTPVSGDELTGFVDLLIRVYRPLPPRFPHGGLMSQHIDSLTLGDEIEIRGPIGEIEYLGDGVFEHEHHGRLTARTALFIGGGTGITPLYMVIRAALALGYDTDRTMLEKLSLVYGNSDVPSILCRDELDVWAVDYKERFELWYTVDRAPEDGTPWNYGVGFIDEKLLRKHAPTDAPGSDDYVFCCGPPPMINACKKSLLKLGYDVEHILCF